MISFPADASCSLWLSSSPSTSAFVALFSVSEAESAVRLTNCYESYSVAAGGSTTIPISGISAFWVVPEEIEWNCSTMPPRLFHADFNHPRAELRADVGLGMFEDKASSNRTEGATDTESTSEGEAANTAKATAEDFPVQSRGIVELSAVGEAAPCRMILCKGMSFSWRCLTKVELQRVISKVSRGSTDGDCTFGEKREKVGGVVYGVVLTLGPGVPGL